MRRALFATLTAWTVAACHFAGEAPVESPVQRPEQEERFPELFANNCAGCHGAAGRSGAALSLANPIYFAVAKDATIRAIVSQGVPGTAMAAFAKSAGGTLTDRQIDAIVAGMRARWASADALRDAPRPEHVARAPGDARRGAQAYATFCASCHGADGRGTAKASSVVDGAYLALVSDQGLRTLVIAGRPDLGAPDFRNDVPGRPMTDEEIGDVVAWLASHRLQSPGQPYSAAQPVAGGLP